METFSQQIKGLKEDRGAKLSALDSLVNKMNNEKRAFTQDEQRQYDLMKSDVESMSQRIAVLEETEKRRMESASPFESGYNGNPKGAPTEEERSISILKQVPQDKERPISDFVLRNYDVDPDIQKASVYKVIRALATGRTPDRATTKALDEVRSVTGSALLNNYLSAQLWDGSIQKSRLAQAGMATIPMEQATHKFAQVSTYPTFEWKSELGSTSDKTTAFTSRTLSANTLRGYVNISGELLKDGINTEGAMRHVIGQSMANSIDTAGLLGTGTPPEPTGVKNYSGLNSYSMGTNGGNITNWTPFLEVNKLMHDDNANSGTAAIMSPRTYKQISALQDSVYNPLGMPEALRSVKFFQTSKVPDNQTQGGSSTCSSIYFGDFTQLNMGVWLDTQVMITPVDASTYSYNLFTAFRGDFLPFREECFGAIVGILP